MTFARGPSQNSSFYNEKREMSNENPNPDLNQYPLGEPSVLDYVKSLFRFGDGQRIQIPDFVDEEQQLLVSG